mgnify:FL=1
MATKPAAVSPLFKNEALHLAFCVTGVVGSLLLYGVLQVGKQQEVVTQMCPVAALTTPEAHNQSWMSRGASLCVQERIMTIPYGVGPDAEVFKYSLFLVFCNRVVAATIAAITLVVSSKRVD